MKDRTISETLHPAKQPYPEWLFLWFLHFQENSDYEAYCDAKRDDDSATCAKLESQFDQVARLYGDWGDIYFLSDGTEIASVELWGQWLETHLHLFLKHEFKAELVYDLQPRRAPPGHLLIDVPLQQHKSDVMLMLKALVDRYYEDGPTELSPEAMYSLYDPHGKLNDGTLTAAKKAYIASVIHERGKLASKHSPARYTRKRWTHWDTAMTLSEDGVFNDRLLFDWALSPIEAKLASDDDEAHIRVSLYGRIQQVKDYLQIYKAHVRNTIHGKFPCKD
jgi:hypothetical protein